MEIIVIGAGPAGMMAAISAAKAGAHVTLLEKNKRQGRKLMITGKGRCNITNNCDTAKLIENTAVNPRFLYSVFSRFGSQDTMAFFEKQGVPLKTERGGRVFPVSDKSVDINDAMVRCCKNAGVRYVGECPAESLIIEDDKVVGVRAGGKQWKCDACVIATGGCSYPLTGSTGDGYDLARAAGHTIVEPKPSLVPLVTAEKDCARMQGLALKNIAITVTNAKGKKVYTDFGELLFTHFGLSGPVILSASSHMKCAEGHTVTIDLKPALTPEQLDARLLRDFSASLNRDISNAMGGLLPSSMVPVFIERAGIPADTKVNSISREQRAKIISLLKAYSLTVTAFRPVEEAIVTSGGVKVGEIDPGTMASKKVGGLYFAGELIDVDAHTGGFNLQIALSTGFCAGNSAAQAES